MSSYSKHTKIGLWLAMMLLLLMQQSCSLAYVDLCADEHPHRGELVVNYDWSELKEKETIPDSMVVWAVRPVFRTKVSSNWDSGVRRNSGAREDSRLYGSIIAPDDEMFYSPHEGYKPPVGHTQMRDSIFLTPGEWVLAAYTSTSATINAARNFTNSLWDEGEMLFVMPTTSKDLPEKYRYWYDRNPYSEWIGVEADASIIMGRATYTVDEYATRDKKYEVTFAPKTLTQVITFGIEAELIDHDVTVDSIVCAVSGVIAGMNVESMVLSVNKTFQGLFHTELSDTPDGNIRAEGNIHVPGLVRSNNKELLQGPGILNVCVFVHFTDDKGEVKYRRLDGTINLFRLLSENPSIVYSSGGEIVQSGPTLRLEIKTRLKISKDKLSSASDAIDPWVDETVIDTDPEPGESNPGNDDTDPSGPSDDTEIEI